ncbi:hypothetical protein L1987_37551 [Smallanthus sonchifolius]|uniref:Uncharacterized protein n=1 Tax=Smallanthus sonchifolius TaxID=185202 RepID=A0ACB9HGR4_9ASTR|nr:hypothetical protein L1987_37551 [Smallanthus sonchifolius]
MTPLNKPKLDVMWFYVGDTCLGGTVANQSGLGRSACFLPPPPGSCWFTGIHRPLVTGGFINLDGLTLLKLVKNLGSEVESNNLSLVGIWKESIRGGILLLSLVVAMDFRDSNSEDCFFAG